MDQHEITILENSRARVAGRVAGIGAVIEHRANVIVLRFAGRKFFNGQGRPQKWASAHYEVHTIIEREMIRGQEVLETRLLVSFSAASHTWTTTQRTTATAAASEGTGQDDA